MKPAMAKLRTAPGCDTLKMERDDQGLSMPTLTRMLRSTRCRGRSGRRGTRKSRRPSADINRGECDCNEAEGFTTYTWWVADQQRCATTCATGRRRCTARTHYQQLLYGQWVVEFSAGPTWSRPQTALGSCVCTTSADNWTFGNDESLTTRIHHPVRPKIQGHQLHGWGVRHHRWSERGGGAGRCGLRLGI